MSRRAILVLVLLSLACGDEVTEPKPEATKVEPVGSNKLTGTVGSALEVMPTVRVLDQKGRPMSGVSVVWDVTRGDGSVDPKSTMTDASGTASTKWTLGPMAGRQSITASAENLPAVAFEAEALPDVPATLEFAGGTDQLAIAGDTLRDPVVVHVRDRFGNAVPGVDVSFSVKQGSGSVAVQRVSTDNTGKASTRVAISRDSKLGELLTLEASTADMKAEHTFRVRRPVLLFVRENNLWNYQVFAMDWIAGTEMPLTPEDEYVGGGMDISPDGSLLALSIWNPNTWKHDIEIRDLATGDAISVYSSPSANAAYPRFSPGGGALTFTILGEVAHTVATYDLRSGAVRADETGAGITRYSNYASDRTLIFSAAFEWQFDLMVRALDIGTNTRLTSTRGEAEYWPDIIPGTDYFVFVCAPLDANYDLVQRDLCAMKLDGSNRQTILEAPEWDDTYPTISHDGKYVAFASARTLGPGVYSIYYAPLSGGNTHPIAVTTSAHETYPVFGILGWAPVPNASEMTADARRVRVAGARPATPPIESELLALPRTGAESGVLAHPGRLRRY